MRSRSMHRLNKSPKLKKTRVDEVLMERNRQVQTMGKIYYRRTMLAYAVSTPGSKRNRHVDNIQFREPVKIAFGVLTMSFSSASKCYYYWSWE